MRAAVTNDLAVLTALVAVKATKKKPTLAWTSAGIASILGLTVFQVTARLKGMEGREFLNLDRSTGLWSLTESGRAAGLNPPESLKIAAAGKPKAAKREADRVARVNAYMPDDSKVPTVTDTSKSAGWRWRTTWRDGRWDSVHIAPDGNEYVFARSTETADLISTGVAPGLPPVRMKLHALSAAKRKWSKADRKKAEAEERDRLKVEAGWCTLCKKPGGKIVKSVAFKGNVHPVCAERELDALKYEEEMKKVNSQRGRKGGKASAKKRKSA